MPIYYRDDLLLCSNHYSDNNFANDNNLKEMKIHENDSLEHILLTQICSSVELISDDMDSGAEINTRNFDKIKLADQLLHEVQEDLAFQLLPSNIKK